MLSPSPAAAYTYAAMHRADCPRHSARRVSARPTVIGLPDRFASTLAPASAASLDGGTGTHRSSQTSTCSTNPATSSAANSRSAPNGATCPASPISPDAPRPHAFASREMPALVELPIVRQVALRHHPEQPPPLHDNRAVVHPPAPPQRRPRHHHQPSQPPRPLRQRRHRPLRRIQQHVLQQQVLDRIPRQRQLGKHRQRHPLRRAFPSQRQHRRHVGHRIGHRHRRHARGHTDEAVAVRRQELHRAGLLGTKRHCVESAGKEARPGLCPGPARGGAPGPAHRKASCQRAAPAASTNGLQRLAFGGA